MGALITYLLDTCTFIWLCADSERLSEAAKSAIDAPEAALLLSDVSALEITHKWSTGKLGLPDPPRHWIEAQIAAWDLSVQPLGRAEIYRVGELPEHHRDPFDRLLVAAALNLNATIRRRTIRRCPSKGVSIEGDRIRIRLRRTGSWPGDHWDAFFFWLPFNNFRGARIGVDGREVALPEVYAEQGRTIAANARRIECNLDDPALNLVLECDGQMSITDRRQYSQLSYLVAVGFPEGEGQSVDLYLTLPEISEMDESGVRYSAIGYPVSGEKKVVLEWPSHLSRPDDRVRLERADGSAVKSGRFGETVGLRHMQSDFAMFDFSEVRQPGDYRVVWAGGEVEFPIRQRVFEDRLWEPTLDYFLVRAADAGAALRRISRRGAEGGLFEQLPPGGRIPRQSAQRAPLGRALHGFRQAGQQRQRAEPGVRRVLAFQSGAGRAVDGSGGHADAVDVRAAPAERRGLRLGDRLRRPGAHSLGASDARVPARKGHGSGCSRSRYYDGSLVLSGQCALLLR